MASSFDPVNAPSPPLVDFKEEGTQRVHVTTIIKDIMLGQYIEVLAGVHSGKKGFVVAKTDALLGISFDTNSLVCLGKAIKLAHIDLPLAYLNTWQLSHNLDARFSQVGDSLVKRSGQIAVGGLCGFVWYCKRCQGDLCKKPSYHCASEQWTRAHYWLSCG